MFAKRSAMGAMLALSAAALFGVSGAVAGGTFAALSPAYVAQARSMIAVVLLVGFAAYRGVLRPRGGMGKLALLGLNLALVNVTFYWAIERLGVGPGATVQFIAPIFVLVWIVVVRNEHVSGVAWVAAVGAVAGVGLVTRAWAMNVGDVVGFGAGFASALLFATYLIYGEYLGRGFAPSHIAAWGFVFASVFWAVVLPWWTFPFDQVSVVGWDLLVVGVLGTAIPFMLEFVALTMASSGVVGIVATAEPPIAAVAAAFLLDQRLAPIQWVGIVVVVVAIAAVERWGLGEVHAATPIV